MKLYGVIYIFGKVAAVVGPYPNLSEEDWHSCEIGRQGQVEDIDQHFRDYGENDPAYRWHNVQVHRKDVRVVCEVYGIPPKYGGNRPSR